MRWHPVLSLGLPLTLIALATGCGERRDRAREDEAAFAPKRVDAVACVVLDLSGSFESLLIGADSRAFVFLTRLIQEFFYQGIGYEQRLVVAMITGSDKALLFDGTVQEFNARFPDPDSFKAHLKRVGSTPGSRVYDSIRDALSYTLSLPVVEKGHTKVGLFCLTDFDDNIRTAQSYPRLEAELKVLGTDYRGVCGFYFIDQVLYAQVVALVQRCGFPRERGVVTSEVAANPPIPTLLR